MTTIELPTPSTDATFTSTGIRQGAQTAIPIAISVFAYSLIFGMLARQHGLTTLETFLMSLIAFSGTAQFVALGLWTTPLPFLTIWGTTLLVSLRHVLLGASVQRWFAQLRPLPRYALVHLLTDENWGLAIRYRSRGGNDLGYFFGSGVIIASAWFAGSVAGHLSTGWLVDPVTWGLDFTFTAFFIVMIVGSWHGKRDLLPWIITAAVSIAAHRWLPGQWYTLLGALAGSIVALVQRAR